MYAQESILITAYITDFHKVQLLECIQNCRAQLIFWKRKFDHINTMSN